MKSLLCLCYFKKLNVWGGGDNVVTMKQRETSLTVAVFLPVLFSWH